MKITNSIYNKSPIFIQTFILNNVSKNINNRRYHKNYIQIFNDCINRNTNHMESYNIMRLNRFIQSSKEINFWADQFNNNNFQDINDKNVVDNIQYLSILKKEQVNMNVNNLINRKFKLNELVKCHTSGTSGSGLIFYQTKEAEHEQWAVWWRYRGWHGINRDTWCGYFGGQPIVPLIQRKPPFFRINKPMKQVMFSNYHINQQNAQSYIETIGQFKLAWLHGYPSSLALLANYMLEQNIKPPECSKIITIGAENLMPKQKNIINAAFGVTIRQHYGQAEAVANFSECDKGNLHVDEDFSYVEFIPIPDQPNKYRIVGTNFTNEAFPLFRYDTDDIAIITNHQCDCGRPGRIVDDIEGRQEDYIYLPNGSMVGRLDHIFKDLIHVHEAQIYQPSVNQIVFRIVKSENYNHDDERILLQEARNLLGNDIEFKIDYPDMIPRSNTGKFKFVVSDLKRNFIL